MEAPFYNSPTYRPNFSFISAFYFELQTQRKLQRDHRVPCPHLASPVIFFMTVQLPFPS